MRKLGIIGLSIIALFTAAAVALAADPAVVTLTGSITGDDGATAKKPKNGTVKVKFNVNVESESTADRITYTLPSDLKLDGGGFKTCSEDQIAQGGEEACPDGSQVGTGTAKATLSGPDPTELLFDIKIYAAGKDKVTLSLVTQLFQTAITGNITGGNKLDVVVPQRVYSPVSGLYTYITEVDATLGPAKTKVKKKVTVKVKRKNRKKGQSKFVKRKRTRKVDKYFAAVSGCSSTRTFAVSLNLIPNPEPPPTSPIGASATGPC